MVPLVGPGGAGGDAPPAVMVPKVEMTGPSGKTEGHFAWWTGDLGVRASLSTADPRADLSADVSSPGDGGLYRVMASQAADIEIHAREILDLRNRLNAIYARHTGQDVATIETAMERDRFMTPDEAKTFGLVDEVVSKRPEADAAAKA